MWAVAGEKTWNRTPHLPRRLSGRYAVNKDSRIGCRANISGWKTTKRLGGSRFPSVSAVLHRRAQDAEYWVTYLGVYFFPSHSVLRSASSAIITTCSLSKIQRLRNCPFIWSDQSVEAVNAVPRYLLRTPRSSKERHIYWTSQVGQYTCIRSS